MKRSRTSSSTSTSKPSSGGSEEPPKKTKKVEKVVAQLPEKPKLHELPDSATLGSLPLYGEKLPEQGYVEVPTIAKQTCDELKEIFAKVREIKQGTGPKVGCAFLHCRIPSSSFTHATHAHIYTHAYTHIHPNTHTYTRVHMHTTHTPTHAYTHAHTHI